jgi:hypothetical protein
VRRLADATGRRRGARAGEADPRPGRDRPTGWPRSYVLAQRPNAPLLIACAGRGLEAVGGAGRAGRVGRGVVTAGLCAWAWGEISDGVNLFRRALGLGALAWLLARRLRAQAPRGGGAA